MAKGFSKCSATGLRYRVRDETDWQEIAPGGTLSFEISINNKSCYEEYLRCQLHWGREHFSHFVFSIGDVLNVYNYRVVGHPTGGVLDETLAVKTAIEEGDQWLDTNLPIIQSVLPTDSYSLMRWMDWREHELFDARLDTLRELYLQNGELRLAIDSDAQAYATRRDPNLLLTDEQHLLLSLHTLEELAVYQIQTEQGPTLALYPGSMPSTYRLVAGNEQVPQALARRQYRYIEIRG